MAATIALQNAVCATPTNTTFMHDLARAVANDQDPETAATWLWGTLSEHGDVWAAYDRYIWTVEAVQRVWPVMRRSATMFDHDCTAPLARFIAERIPAAVNDTTEAHWFKWAKPVTAAVVLADRAHDLAALFSVGLKPNGSKDPYALRRSAKHFIIAARMSQLASVASC